MHDEGTPERRARTTRKLENKYKKLRGGKRGQRKRTEACCRRKTLEQGQKRNENGGKFQENKRKEEGEEKICKNKKEDNEATQ